MNLDALEIELAKAEAKIQHFFQSGQIPPSTAYAEVDSVRAKLKVARRVRSMDSKRVTPKLTKQIGIRLTADEYSVLTQRAIDAGVDLSRYIRDLLKI